MVLGVIEIVLKFLDRILNRSTVGVPYLGPAGDARLHRMAADVVGNLFGQLFNKVRALGTRADKAHVTLQHIENLRQLIYPKFSYHTPDSCYAIVIFCCPLRGSA